MYDNYVSLKLDDFITDCDTTIWIASISDGSYIYQDDDRPGYEPSSWHRLKKYCEENKLSILDINLKFRSHLVNIGPADGYFFIKSILAGWGLSKNFHFYKIGKLIDNKLIVDKWKIPELILESSEERSIEEDVVQRCLILNDK